MRERTDDDGPSEPSSAWPHSRRLPVRTGLIFVLVSLLSAGVAVAAVLTRTPLTVVAVAGNLPMLDDPGTREVLRDEGLDVQQTPFGTPRARGVDLTRHDLIVTGSEVQAKLVADQLPGATKTPWIPSPLVVLTRTPITTLLQKVGVARQQPGGAWTFDVVTYLREIHEGRRWIDIVGADGKPLRGSDGAAIYPSPIAMLVSTTDPRTSNSAAMFVAIVSYLSNGSAVVTEKSVGKVLRPLGECFEPQGNMPTRTPDLMDKFLSGGTPMALVYENDYRAALNRDPALAGSMVAMYPTENVTSDNTLIARTDAGKQLMRRLKEPGRIRDLARTRWGYEDSASAGPPSVVAEVPVPTAPVLKRLLDGI